MHRVIQALSSFILVLSLLNIWGGEEYGVYAYYMSVITVLLALAEFGTPNVFRREYANSTGLSAREVFSNLFVLRLCFIVPISLCFLGLAWSYSTWFFVSYSCIVLLLAYRLSEYVLEVNFRNGVISRIKSLVYIVGLALKLTLVYYGKGVEFLALVTLIEHMVFTLVFTKLAKLSFSFRSVSLKFIKGLFYMSTAFALTYIVLALGAKLYTLLVFNLLGEQQTGVFAFSARLVEVLLIPTQAFFVIFLPLLMKTSGNNKFETLYSDIVCAFFYIYLLGLSIFLLLQDSIMAVLINNPREIVSFMNVYVISIPFMVLFSLSTVYYTVKGRVRIIFIRSCVFLVLSLILGVSLIEVMGLKGVVWATLLTYFLVELFSYLFISEAKEELILRGFGILKLFEVKTVFVRLYKIKIEG